MRLGALVVALLGAARGDDIHDGSYTPEAPVSHAPAAPEAPALDPVVAAVDGASFDAPRPPECRVVALARAFPQDAALQELETVKALILGEINGRVDSVVAVSVAYDEARGDAVGPRTVRLDITTAVGGLMAEECLLVTYDVVDTDECAAAGKWRHQCGASALCVNTEGSYYCECADEAFGKLGSGVPTKRLSSRLGALLKADSRAPKRGLCWGHADTRDCCGAAGACGMDECTEACVADFFCARDACAQTAEALCPAHSTCAPLAFGGHAAMWAATEAARAQLRGGFECTCNASYEDDGVGGCAKIAEVLQPDYCADNDCPCNCDCVADTATEGYTCEPAPGYMKSHAEPNASRGRRRDSGNCVRGAAPSLRLVGGSVLRLRQGDAYVELGADVVDALAPAARGAALKIAYPRGALSKCVGEIGDFEVIYTAAGLPPLTRKIVVRDVDECAYAGACPQFVHGCAANAACANLVGGYDCICPRGTAGDGLALGTACADVEAPHLACAGAGCHAKAFRATDIQGIVSTTGEISEFGRSDNFEFARGKIRRIFDAGVAEGVDAFCETLRTTGAPCFVAHDLVYAGGAAAHVDVTKDIRLANLTLVDAGDEMLRYDVFYAVADAAGNAAIATRKLVVTTVSEEMRYDLGAPPGALRRRLVAVIFGLLLAVAFLFRAALARALPVLPYALLYAVLPPRQLLYYVCTREAFVDAVDLWLAVSRLGTMTARDRLRIALLEWSELQNQLDEDDDM